MEPFEHLEVGRIQKLTNDRSKFNFTTRYLHRSDKGSNQIMQPMLPLSSTCINLRHGIVDTSKGSEKMITIVKTHPMVVETNSGVGRRVIDDTYQMIVTNYCIWRLTSIGSSF